MIKDPVCGMTVDPSKTPHHAEHDGRALLGRQPSWPAGRYSALAGFLEPGESIEEAVAHLRREAFEVQARDEARRRQEQPQSQSRPKNDIEDTSTLPTLQLQPPPILKPTAYSSRMIYTDAYPSSPPPETERLPAVTPRHRRIEYLDPESAEKCDGGCEQSELTSSVVKGRVAEGLLGLRHAV